AYHRLLADERDPAERAGGLTEWGSGEARIVAPHVCAATGEKRDQFESGEAISLRLTLAASTTLPPPRLSYELRDEADRLLAGGGLDPAEVSWPDAAGEVAVRFDVASLPLAHGRFHFALSLASPDSGHVYHRLEPLPAFAH